MREGHETATALALRVEDARAPNERRAAQLRTFRHTILEEPGGRKSEKKKKKKQRVG